VDFGAGDGRFAAKGTYAQYVGYEIDPTLYANAWLPSNATLINRCAFSDLIEDADVCIGNPPFVRYQDLPRGWRQQAADVLYRRLGIVVSGLANAWQYFFLLALASAHDSGLCALIIPYEWVSRPSSRAVREYIASQGWNVSVFRLVDTTFSSVLTTSAITIVDKSKRDGCWRYFEELSTGAFSTLDSPSGGLAGVIPYLPRRGTPRNSPVAKRGLSPGTQKVLTLTEGERVRSGLLANRDVVPCITSLRHLPSEVRNLDVGNLREHYVASGQKCWLIRTDIDPTRALAAYLASVPLTDYQTSTCLAREKWWKFAMPEIPEILVSMSFKGSCPKAVRNSAGVRAVGGVYGIHNLRYRQIGHVLSELGQLDIRDRIVAHSNGLRKIEVGQLNSLLLDALGQGHQVSP
jgi:hypothetical protein